MLSGVLATTLGSLWAAEALRCLENSVSTASEGWTETMTSLERYAILATKIGEQALC